MTPFLYSGLANNCMISPKTGGYFPNESIQIYPLEYFKSKGVTQPHLAPKQLAEGVSSILKSFMWLAWLMLLLI